MTLKKIFKFAEFFYLVHICIYIYIYNIIIYYIQINNDKIGVFIIS